VQYSNSATSSAKAGGNVNTNHSMTLGETGLLDKKYSHLIRRLQKAVSDSEMKKRMDFEDGMIDDLKEMQRSIDTLEQKTRMISEEKDRIYQNGLPL
jgi:hypothetical protein